MFSVHIRAAGGWTNALYHLVSAQNNKWNDLLRSVIGNKQNKINPDTSLTDAKSDKSMLDIHELSSLKVYVDGPYSAPSSTIFTSEHAVLVATGIGVTPFASILQSIVARLD